MSGDPVGAFSLVVTMAGAIYIYALVDPCTLEIRYIGKTKMALPARLKGHVYEARRRNTHKDRWIATVLDKGLRPFITLIDTAEEDTWPWLERWWIAYYRDEGAMLTNSNAGGLGGHDPSPELRARMSVAQRTRFELPEERSKLSRAAMGHSRNIGHKHTPETRAKMSVTQRNRPPISEETRAKLSAASRNLSPETRAKKSEAQRRRPPVSDETRAKRSASLKGRKFSLKTRERMATAARGRKSRRRFPEDVEQLALGWD